MSYQIPPPSSPAPAADDRPLPPGWIKEWDDTYKAWYYVDTARRGITAESVVPETACLAPASLKFPLSIHNLTQLLATQIQWRTKVSALPHLRGKSGCLCLVAYYSSLPRRALALKKAKGANTKY
ncbi:hypothetical protein GLOTRDRAFT_132636 [Gloeophyllum trabeum ATCC 11539]|uniref:WW domain-containing protein n=1 Tax=Gloeophyllum trabeum (strain ATCC 11539 / FP-39264 / Madison 617) TaxID=670483 RepID=S7RC60_GLOTA|nr:uncharacterized protein GLOTRDRAFT_132636 [Gloeophyllum trabeum ATCC 11539]EPQ51825.1 hypothetical protein GLOTRDRAFT_132636 [Gloeophyllum trabeum ATCC 11539]